MDSQRVYGPSCITKTATDTRGGFTFGQGGNCTQTRAKCDVKQCLTNSKHIGAERNVLWLSEYAKMRFRSELRSGPPAGGGAPDAALNP